MIVKTLLIVAIALFAVALVLGVVVAIQRREIWGLRLKLFDMSGLEPVMWEDAEWESQEGRTNTAYSNSTCST